MFRRALALLFVLTTASVASAQLTRSAAWSADIDFLARSLPSQHPNPFSITPQAVFASHLAALKADVPTLTDYEIAVRLQQAVALLRDGHTEVDTRLPPITSYPLRLYRFGQSLVVTKTTAASAAACGARVVAIDGVPIEDVYERVVTTISRENDVWAAHRAPAALVRAELLQALRVTGSTASAVFTFERSGRMFDLELTPISVTEAAATVNAPDVTTPDTPLYRRDSARRYWFAWQEGDGLLYVKYNRCSEDPALPFASFTAQIEKILDEQSVRVVVVDLRDNPGGNSSIAQPLIRALQRRSHLRGRLFAIIGRATFSSGIINAIQLRDDAGAVLAGEPTGGKPWSYGEVRSFLLPNSAISVYHSTKFFKLEPVEHSSLEPRIRIDITAADYFRGRDPVLEAVLPAPAQGTTVGTSARRRAAVMRDVIACPQ